MIPGVVKKLLARLGRRNEGRSYKLFLRLEMNDFDNSLSELFLSLLLFYLLFFYFFSETV